MPQLLELEHKGGEVSTKDIMSVVGDKMSDHFEEYFCEHGGQSGGEQKSENAAKGLKKNLLPNTGCPVSSETWSGLTDFARQLANMVEHPNQSRPIPGLRPDGTPCISA